MPSEPTLAEFAEAFEAVRSKHPDAPGLPEGYKFKRPSDPLAFLPVDHKDIFLSWHGSWCEVVPDAAALALCVTTAMKIGAWWEMLTPERFEGTKMLGGEHQWSVGWNPVRKKWFARVQWIKHPEAEMGRCWCDYSEHDTLESACLAALWAIPKAVSGEVG